MLEGAPDAACREALERWSVPGAVVGVLAAGRSEVRAYGVADLETGEALRPETVFGVASITKPFLATLALRLEDEGLLALDRPAPVPLPTPAITPAQLLAHVGGFEGEAGDLARFGDGDDALPRVVAELPRHPQVVPPGTYWSYCNAGYWAVALLCAQALATTFEDALHERVLGTLALGSTGFGPPEARGHVQPDPASPRHVPAPRVPYPRARRPSGGLASNVPDLLRFAALHLGDERLARLRAPVAATPAGEYGLGWMIERTGEVEVVFHPGSYGGYRTVLALLPAHDAAFAILTNGTGGEAVVRDVSAALVEALTGARREPPPTVPLPAAELEALAGRYEQRELHAQVAPGGAGIVLDAVELGRDGSRTELRFEARPVGGRTFAIAGGLWDGELLDFLPATGPVGFARIGSVLTPRC